MKLMGVLTDTTLLMPSSHQNTVRAVLKQNTDTVRMSLQHNSARVQHFLQSAWHSA